MDNDVCIITQLVTLQQLPLHPVNKFDCCFVVDPGEYLCLQIYEGCDILEAEEEFDKAAISIEFGSHQAHEFWDSINGAQALYQYVAIPKQ